MKTENFTKIIQALTGRDFNINTDDTELIPSKKYTIYRVLPITKIPVSFNFICPKKEDTIIKSFINNFTKKYREPDPKKYNKEYGGTIYRWDDKTAEEKELAYLYHANNMFSPQKLMDQVKTNLNTKGIEDVLCKYGFYPTNYGIGIFILYSTIYEQIAVNKMKEYLRNKGIPFKNEFSDAKWVYRFIVNIDKTVHNSMLKNFNSIY